MLHSGKTDGDGQSHRPSNHTSSHTNLLYRDGMTCTVREEKRGKDTTRVQSGITKAQVKDDSTKGNKGTQEQGSLVAQSSSQNNCSPSSATPTGRLTPRERRALAHIHSSCSSLSRGHGSRGSSPLTSSWESFSQGVTLRERQQSRRKERLEQGERSDGRRLREKGVEQKGEVDTAVADDEERIQGLMNTPSERKKV